MHRRIAWQAAVWSGLFVGDAAFRLRKEDLARLPVRSASGAVVPIASQVMLRVATGPDRGVRHNGYPSAEVSGAPAPGFGSSQAQAAMEGLARETLPRNPRGLRR